MVTTGRRAAVLGPGLGETQRALLLALKRRGVATLAELARGARVAVGTVREHLHALAARGLVERRGARRARGRGRPAITFGLSPDAEALFPRQEGELLQGLVRFLEARGQGGEVEEFLRERIADQRAAALARVRGLLGPARLAETARILSEAGFMAESARGADGEPTLRLCHCPIRDLVAVTRAPCRLEIAFAEELVGHSLARTSYIPDGDAACGYRTGAVG